MTIELRTRRDTRRLGAKLAALLRPGDAVFLEGPLGAGKTFLVRAIARALGVPAREPIQSPTFALVHEIESGRAPIVHADLYRLTDASELDLLALPEALTRAIVLIEWGERFAPAIAHDGIVITIGLEGGRTASVRGLGPRGVELSSALAAA